jgi:uncharacterized phage infection (PIP) family protein YhgE
MKRFSTFLKELNTNGKQLEESSAFGKGYALGQQARFASVKSKLTSLASELEQVANSGKSARSSDDKLNTLFDSQAVLADLLKTQSELLTHIMYVAVSGVLLSDNLPKTVRQVIDDCVKRR